MKRISVIDSTIRDESRTRELLNRILDNKDVEFSIYNINKFDLIPTNNERFITKGTNETFIKIAKEIASSDGLVIAAPFWDMTYPALLKTFLEELSLYDIMFIDDGKTCVGISKMKFMLFLTTRGMNIEDDSKLDGASYSLKALCELWGIPQFACVSAYNLDYSSDEEIKTKLKEAGDKAERVFAQLIKD